MYAQTTWFPSARTATTWFVLSARRDINPVWAHAADDPRVRCGPSPIERLICPTRHDQTDAPVKAGASLRLPWPAMSTPMAWLRPIFSNAFDSFSRHRLPRLAATLAYYTLFSIAPLMVIALVIAGSVIDTTNVADGASTETQVFAQLEEFVGEGIASTVESLVTTQQEADSGDSRTATIIGAVILFIGASGMFQALQDALNTVWDIPIDEVRGILRSLVRRVYGVISVFIIGLLMSVFVVGATILTLVIPDWAGIGMVIRGINILIGFLGMSVVTALVFRWLPARKVPWRAAWAGGVLTTIMLAIGSTAIGLIIAQADPGAAFGQFAAIIVLLVYIYYSAQIFLLGAELTAAYVQVRIDTPARA